MAWGRVTTIVRRGSMARPKPDFLNSLPIDKKVKLPDEQRIAITTTKTCARIFRPTVTWEFDTTDFVIKVTEKVQFGWRWIAAVLIATCLVVAGEILRWISLIDPTTSIAATVLGAGLLSILHAIVARYTVLDRTLFSVTSWDPKFTGGAALSFCCLLIVLGMTNIFSVLAALILGCIILLSISSSEPPFQSLGNQIRTTSAQFPRIPARHAIYTILSATALATFNASVMTLAVPRPVLVITGGVVVFLIVAGLLWHIPNRSRARPHAFGAAVLSGGYTLFLVAELALGSQVVGPALSQTAILPMIAITLGVMLFWGGAWWVGVVNPQRIEREFSTSGRQVNTHVAAIFAYLAIMGSGFLGLAALVSLPVLWQLLAMGITPWFGFVIIAAWVPLLYFVVGSLYQLMNVVRLSWRFRKHATPVPEDRIPTESVYPVRSIPSEILHTRRSEKESEQETVSETGDTDTKSSEESGKLFAAAYADPFGKVILVTEHTLLQLPDKELTAIIAHEESHFKHRGAQLQLLFATLPAVALMGKNVVFSIYDFYRRELTADQHAYVQLASGGESSPATPLQTTMTRFELEALPLVDETSLGFLPTMLSAPKRAKVESLTKQLFELFYGNFAGDVHPSVSTRRHALSLSDDLSIEIESDPEGRARLIFEEIKQKQEK